MHLLSKVENYLRTTGVPTMGGLAMRDLATVLIWEAEKPYRLRVRIHRSGLDGKLIGQMEAYAS